MKACMITYSIFDTDTRVMRYADAIVERGGAVDVFGLGRRGGPGTTGSGGVHVFNIGTRGAHAAGRVGYICGLLLFFLRAMLKVTLRHLKEPYAVIHVHSVPDCLVFSALLPKLLGARVILDIHDLLPELYMSKYENTPDSPVIKLLLWTERMSCAFADHVIAANDLWHAKLIARSVKRDRCSVLVNVPDRKLFYRQGRKRTDGRYILIYPGTLNQHQGLDIAIRAFDLVKTKLPGAEFHIYGEGPCQNSLRQLAEALKLDGRVVFKGFLSTREISRIIEEADLGVVPKRKDGFGNEAFSTKIMEFMALGVPVIVSDTKVDRHYFTEDVVEFFPAGDYHELATAILRVAQNVELRNRRVGNALRFVERNSWDVKKTEYLEVLDLLAAGLNHTEAVRS